VTSAALDEVRPAGGRLSFTVRVCLIAAVLCLERTLLKPCIDFDAMQAASSLGSFFRLAQQLAFRLAVTLGAALALFLYMRRDASLAHLNAAARALPVRRGALLAHLALVASLVPLSYLLYGSHPHVPRAAALLLWLGVGCAAVGALCAAMASWALWRQALRVPGTLWIYATAAAAIAVGAMQWSLRLWTPMTSITFELVRRVLAPLLPQLQADPLNQVLYTQRFAIQIAEQCSGLEGIGLMLAFCGAWLWYFRREYIFPRALALIPIGVLLTFALNTVRIAALVLIGQAGFADVAVSGFHSQAGWIAFNFAAGAIVVVSRRSSWLNRTAGNDASHEHENPTAAYLVPFLAVLAASMLARAVSGGFETWYGLEPLAGMLALWYFRRELLELDWRCSWRGLAAGILGFALWILAARLLTTTSGMPAALQALPTAWRTLWILARIVGAAAIVPLAEELAYRGYLLRRLVARDFAAQSFQKVGIWPLLASAVVFGLVHGAMWLPGIAVGVIYGALVIRTGRIGEAVCAHATTNALLAAAVLTAGQWQLW